MKILVTGATGMIGKDLVEALAHSHEVRQMWRYTATRGLVAPTNVIWVDLKDGDFIRPVREFEPDIIVHLGALASNHIANQYPVEAMQTNAVGTARLIEATQQVPNLKCFILASSAEVYGEPADVLTEETPIKAIGPYHASKIAAEQAVRGSGLPFVISRPFNTYGRAKVGSAVAVADKWILLALQNRSIPLGGVTAIRDFMFRPDHVDAYVKIVEAIESGATVLGETFVFTPGEAVSLQQLYDVIGGVIPMHTGGEYNRAVDIPVIHGDSTKARDMLGWYPRWYLHEGIKQSIEEWRHTLGYDKSPGRAEAPERAVAR